MDNRKISQFISELRKEQGLNQRELAEKLSVTDKAVSKWETGRGIPDVSILQPLAGVLGVTVTEILNGERMPQQESKDEQLIKKLKIKRYIRLAIEMIITAFLFWGIYIFYDTFKLFANVLDIYLHRNEIEFLSICTFVFIVFVVIWVLTVMISAVRKRKAAVIKTIIICFTFSFTVGGAVHMAVLEDSRPLQMYDSPIDTVRYIKYDDFFDDEFNTQISIKDTNEKITENYTAFFDGKDEVYNFVYTKCVTASEYSIIKTYYNRQKNMNVDNENYNDLDSTLCEILGASEGYYVTKLYTENDIELCVIKGTSCFVIDLANADISNERLLEKIAKL